MLSHRRRDTGVRGNLESFINRKADFEGCTKKTMDSLKKAIGIEPKHKDMDR